ncbi:10775_t:CDS:2, partial [Diversispora eburnea]
IKIEFTLKSEFSELSSKSDWQISYEKKNKDSEIGIKKVPETEISNTSILSISEMISEELTEIQTSVFNDCLDFNSELFNNENYYDNKLENLSNSYTGDNKIEDIDFTCSNDK